jgi:hypothetical protein
MGRLAIALSQIKPIAMKDKDTKDGRDNPLPTQCH